jgi:iron complex outermembrane receptor protein
VVSSAFAQGDDQFSDLLPFKSFYLADAKTREPIQGALVTINLPKGPKRGYSKVHGEIKISVFELQYPIQIHALGYNDTSLSDIKSLDSIFLVLNPLLQKEITVTAQRHASVSQDVPISTSVMRKGEIMEKSPKAIDDVLRYIPGVSVTESQVNIRGSSGYARAVGSRVLFLLDGMPLLSADNGDIKFDAVPLIDVERIEVVKGAGSALYGSSALGGIINVITRDAEKDWKGALHISGGTYDQPKYESWKIPSIPGNYYSMEGGVSGKFGAAGRENGVLASLVYRRNEGYRLGDDSYKWNGFVKVNTPLAENSMLTVSLLGASEDHGGWLYWKDQSNAFFPSDSLSAVNERITSNKGNFYAAYKVILADKINLDLKGSVFYTKFTTEPLTPDDTQNPHSTALSYNLDGQTGLFITENLYLTSGLTGGYQTVNSDLFQIHTGFSTAVYSQAEWSLSNLIFTLGLRGDAYHYDSQKWIGSVSPKLGVTLKASDEITLRSSLGTGFRAPSITEKYTDQVLNGFTIKPNPDLQPEKGYSVEIGGGYQTPLVSFDGAIFYSRFNELIEPGFVTSSSSAYIQFRNITKAEIFGHEEVVEFAPFENESLKLRVGYTYIYPHDITKNEILNFRPRHLVQSRIETKLLDFDASADFRYISRYESVDSVLIQQVPDGDARVNAYILDARIGYSFEKILNMPLRLSFQVQNLLNYYYVEIVGNMAPLRNFTLKLETYF